MTILNSDLAAVYTAAADGKLGRDARKAAAAADLAYVAIRGRIATAPNDDRAENFVHQAFAFALTALGLDWRTLVFAARNFGRED